MGRLSREAGRSDADLEPNDAGWTALQRPITYNLYTTEVKPLSEKIERQ